MLSCQPFQNLGSFPALKQRDSFSFSSTNSFFSDYKEQHEQPENHSMYYNTPNTTARKLFAFDQCHIK